MSADRDRKLRSTQRRMLRLITGIGRKSVLHRVATGGEESLNGTDSSDDSLSSQMQTMFLTDADSSSLQEEANLEDYTEWVRRATHIAEGEWKRAGLEDWVTMQRRWAWRWAGK
eukprot:11042333-Karenia_brevis.AAC.1